jgi:hypothetical protein
MKKISKAAAAIFYTSPLLPVLGWNSSKAQLHLLAKIAAHSLNRDRIGTVDESITNKIEIQANSALLKATILTILWESKNENR